MTKRLRLITAIEAVIATHSQDAIDELEAAYTEDREYRTVTMERIEFLEGRLRLGDNKRAAARALTEHDPRIGQKAAETLVYTSFSGMYQNPRKKRRTSAETHAPIIHEAPPSVNAEEDLL